MPGLANNLSKADHMILGRGIFGDGKERLMAMEIVSDYLRTSGRKQEIVMPYFLVRIGEVEKAIELFRSSTTTFDALFLYAVWAPYGTKTRQHPAFKELAQDIFATRPQCFAQTDLLGTLSNGNKHNVHDADASHKKRDACNERNECSKAKGDLPDNLCGLLGRTRHEVVFVTVIFRIQISLFRAR